MSNTQPNLNPSWASSEINPAFKATFEEQLFSQEETTNYPPTWISGSRDVKRCVRAAKSPKTSTYIFIQLAEYRTEKAVKVALLANPTVPDELKILWSFEWGLV